MNYCVFELYCGPEVAEILPAFLQDTDIEAFEESESGLRAYAQEKADIAAIEQILNALRDDFDFLWEKKQIPGQNWNALWESAYEPVRVGDFIAVRADFHPPAPDVRYDVVILPKMAFGTGHHETTWMCLDALQSLPLAGRQLLDYGCGAGILAIAALMAGAQSALGLDIQLESVEATYENARLNGVASQIEALHGDIDRAAGRAFDGIFANINRNVILQNLPALRALARPDAWLLLSGFLTEDAALVRKAAERQGFVSERENAKGRWALLHLRLP
ncbi:MAG: 50S ribosomal protein L11 methyltransferase [Saprospiraceae bacterium]